MTPEGLELINERARDNNVGLYHSWLVDRDHWNALVEEIREQWTKVQYLREALIGIRGLEGDPIGCISEARDLAREALEETK